MSARNYRTRVDFSRHVGQRLEGFIRRLGYSVTEAANRSDVPRNSLYSAISGTAPGAYMLWKLRKGLGISIDELLTEQQDLDPRFVRVSLYQVKAPEHAKVGSGEVFPDLKFNRDWLSQRLGKDLDRVRVVMADGDSMSPLINDGDLVLIDEGERNPKDGVVFAVRMGETLMLKRVHPKPHGMIELRDEATRDREKPALLSVKPGDDFEIVGRAFWHGGRL